MQGYFLRLRLVLCEKPRPAHSGGRGAGHTSDHRGTGFAGPLVVPPFAQQKGGAAKQHGGMRHFNHPRLRKYSMGPTALASISSST